jgi:hypothetical protein
MSRRLAGKKLNFISHLESWLSVEFPGDFTYLGDCLTHTVQTDYIHCGIYSGNTIELALFGTTIPALSEFKGARLEWFKRFAHRAGLGVRS